MNVSNERIAKWASFDVRKSIAERFGIIKKLNVSVERINLTLCPRRLQSIKEDENCFFRADSLIITGNVDEHKSIREKALSHTCNEIHEQMTGNLNTAIKAHICETKILEGVGNCREDN